LEIRHWRALSPGAVTTNSDLLIARRYER
jgi:hypothetical protein